MRCAYYAVALMLGVMAAGCSNGDKIDAATALEVGKRCQGADDPACGLGGVCVLGVCRLGCTTDAECPQEALCVGDRSPFACTMPSELACSASQPCEVPLTCGIDGKCRTACDATTGCPRNEQECRASTCVSHNEPHAAETWFSCEDGKRTCENGDAWGCNISQPGQAVVEKCASDCVGGACSSVAR